MSSDVVDNFIQPVSIHTSERWRVLHLCDETRLPFDTRAPPVILGAHLVAFQLETDTIDDVEEETTEKFGAARARRLQT